VFFSKIIGQGSDNGPRTDANSLAAIDGLTDIKLRDEVDGFQGLGALRLPSRIRYPDSVGLVRPRT